MNNSDDTACILMHTSLLKMETITQNIIHASAVYMDISVSLSHN